MKHTVAIIVIVCVAFFALLGVFVGWGAAHYHTSGGQSSTNRDSAAVIFVLVPLGGSVVGAVVGCLAVNFGKRYGGEG